MGGEKENSAPRMRTGKPRLRGRSLACDRTEVGPPHSTLRVSFSCPCCGKTPTGCHLGLVPSPLGASVFPTCEMRRLILTSTHRAPVSQEIPTLPPSPELSAASTCLAPTHAHRHSHALPRHPLSRFPPCSAPTIAQDIPRAPTTRCFQHFNLPTALGAGVICPI